MPGSGQVDRMGSRTGRRAPVEPTPSPAAAPVPRAAPAAAAVPADDRSLFHALPAALVALSETNQVLDGNAALYRWLGPGAPSWVGRTFADVVHPAEQLRLARALRSLRDGHLGTFRVPRPDGAVLQAAFDLCSLDRGGPRLVLVSDRSALAERERDARRLRRRLDQFVLDAPVGLFEAAADGRITFTNARWEQLHRGATHVTRWIDAAHPGEWERLGAVHAEVLGRRSDDAVGVSYRGAAGTWLRARLTCGRDDQGGPCVVGVVEDMTAQQQTEQELVTRALHDPLTGLANRVKLRSELDAALRRHPGRVAVVLIDLDGFKAVNDSHGHAAGDALLVHVGARLRSACGVADVVARLGGDEFAAVLVDVDPRAAAAVVRAMTAALAEPCPFGPAVLQASASVGLVHCRAGGCHDPEALLEAADRAMYADKEAGGAAREPAPARRSKG